MAIEASTLAIKVTSDGIKEASTALSGLTTSARNSEKQVSALAQAFDKLEKASKTATGQADAFNVKMMQQVSTLSVLKADTSSLVAATASLSAAMAALSATIGTLPSTIKVATTSQRQHNEAMREGHALARGLAGSLGALWVTYGNLAGMAVGIAAGFTLKSVIKEGMEFEHILESIRVKGNETTESIAKMRDMALEMGKGIYGPKEVAQAFEVLILAGLKAEQALVSVKAALNLATVGGISIEKSAEAVVSISTAIGYSAEGFDRVADVIAKTAAISMSSVGSLAEAFKSASSVNTIYGVSLEDIAVQLAVLSNLGIKGSAAGTAVKNMYKELNSDADKVAKTLKAVGVNISDIKTPDGKFKDFIEVVKVLDGALGKLQGGERIRAEERLTNERGLRDYAAAMKAYHTTVIDENGKAVNALMYMREQAENSYGYAAKGAIQLALTTKNQFASVKNTLESTFISAFSAIEPELQIFAVRLREAFDSPAFKKGIQDFVVWTIAFTKSLADGVIVVASIVGWLAKWADIGLTINKYFSPVALMFATTKDAVKDFNTEILSGDKASQAAKIYSDGYINGLIKEAENLKIVTDKMLEKKTLQQSINEAMKEEAKMKLVTLNNLAIAEKASNLATASVAGNRTEIIKAQIAYKAAIDNSTASLFMAKKAEEVVYNESKRRAAAVEAEAKRNRAQNNGTGILGTTVKGSKATANAEYAAAQIEYDMEIKASRKELLRFEEEANRQFKAGELGRLQVIEMVSKKSIEVANDNLAVLRDELAKAEAAPKSQNRTPDIARINGLIRLEEEKLADDIVKFTSQKNIRLAQLDEENFQRQIKTLEAAGKFVEAAELKYGAGMSVATKQLANEIKAQEEAIAEYVSGSATISEDRLDNMIRTLNALKTNARGLSSLKFEMVGLAKTKENMAKVDAELSKMKNSIADILGYATAEGGIASALNAAQLVDDINSKAIPSLLLLQAAMKAAMDADLGNSEKASAYEEVTKKIRANSDAAVQAGVVISNAYTKAGDSIANSFTKAFGKAGAAAGAMIKTYTDGIAKQTRIDAEYYANAIKYPNKLADLSEKRNKDTLDNSIDTYAGMAGAAKGFFSQQSTAYKVLEGIEKAFHAYKLALALASFIKQVFFTEAVVAAEVSGDGIRMARLATTTATSTALAGTDASAWGIVAVVKAIASLPFPFNLAAGAATLAAVVGIGAKMMGSMGGGSGVDLSKQRQETQGTGSVFGDSTAKSQSISHGIDILSKNSDISLVKTNEMLRALHAIRDNILGVVNSVLRTTGLRGGPQDTMGLGLGSSRGFLGFSSSSTELVDQGIQIGTPTTTSTRHTTPGRNFSQPYEESGGEQPEEQVYYTEETTFKPQTIGQVRNSGMLEGTKYSNTHSESSSFFGLFSDSSDQTVYKDLDKDIKHQMALTVVSIADGVAAAASVLGMGGEEVKKKIEDYNVELGLISLKGLSGQALQDELNAVFSKFADGLVESVMSSTDEAGNVSNNLAPFQKAGEGMFETLIRVATGIEKATVSLGYLGIEAIKYTDILNKQGDVEAEIVRQSIVRYETTGPELLTAGSETRNGGTASGQQLVLGSNTTGIGKIMQGFTGTAEAGLQLYSTLVNIRNVMKHVGASIADVTQVMLDAAGGEDKLLNSVKSYYDLFFTEEEKKANTQKDLEKGFADLGVTMPKSKDEFKNLVNAQDLSTVAGQKMYAKLMLLAPAFGEAANAADEAAAAATAQAEANRKAAEESRKATTASFNAAIAPYRPNVLGTLEGNLANENNAAMAVGQSMGIWSWSEVVNMTPEQLAGLTDKQRELLTEYVEARKATDAYKEAVKQNTMSYHEAVMRMNGANDAAVNKWKETNLMAQITALTPGIKSVEQALSLTDEEFAALPIATQNLILQLFPLRGSLTATANAAAEAAQKMYEAQQQLSSSQIDFNIKAFQTRLHLVDQAIKDAAGGDSGKEMSDMIAYQKKIRDQEQLKLNSLYALGGTNNDANVVAARQNILEAGMSIEKLTKDYLLYLQLESQYTGKGKELLDLENWYDEQKKIAQGNSEALLLIEEAYGVKRNKIINGTLSAGLVEVANNLRKWMLSLKLNESLSPLTAQQRKEEARKAYMETLTKANAGDKDALGQITKDAETYLNAAKEVSGFGGDYSSIYAAIMANIEALATANDEGGSGVVTTTVVTADSFAPVVTAQNNTTNAVVALGDEINSLKETLARLLEKQNDIVSDGNAQITTAVVASGDGIMAGDRRKPLLTKKN